MYNRKENRDEFIKIIISFKICVVFAFQLGVINFRTLILIGSMLKRVSLLLTATNPEGVVSFVKILN